MQQNQSSNMSTQRRPFLVGVTGGIGTGKSSACRLLAEKHTVLSSDAIARELLETNEYLMSQIKDEFGEEAYEAPGKLNRKYLAEIVFSNEDKLAAINAIVHPVTVDSMLQQVQELGEQGHTLVFVESALIFEVGVNVLYDAVIAIVADREKVLLRFQEMDSHSTEDIIRRMDKQLSQEEKAKRADFVIRNNGTKEDLERSTSLILTIIESMARQHASA
jgi:dephospho-CoA kinase